MRRHIYKILCLVPVVLGLVAGGVLQFYFGFINLSPNLGAVAGVGLIYEIGIGAFWGAVIGLGIGGICCLLWYVFVLRQTMPTTADAVLAEGEVWPPAPKMQASGAVNAPSIKRPSDEDENAGR